MKKINSIKAISIIAAFSLAIWFLYPSVVFYSKSYEKRMETISKYPRILKKIITLGLDLQGGMRLVLELDRSGLTGNVGGDALDRAYTVIENRINGLGVAEPTIQKQGNDRLIIELPGLRDPKIARDVIGSTARLEFKLVQEAADFEKAVRVIDKVIKAASPVDSSTVAGEESDSSKLEDLATASKLFEGKEGEEMDQADTAVSLAGSFSELIFQSDHYSYCAYEQDIPAITGILAREDVSEALKQAGLGHIQFLWGYRSNAQDAPDYRELYCVREKAMLFGDVINDADAGIATDGMDAGQWKIDMSFNGKGASMFSRITGANVGRQLAIVLDRSVYSAPVIRERIPHGRAQISGNFTAEEAKTVAIVLRAGALPAPVTIVEERTVGPSLGQDSIKLGVRSAIIGMAAVLLFMAWYYRMSGIYAGIALLFNVLYVIALMAAVNATLTLPGIAGLALNLSMAVDANVLICERIREELKIGKRVQFAIKTGYDRALITIMDANLTTLITAGILLWIGTGPIKGFAITLAFGIIISLFTSLVITRVLYQLFTDIHKPTLSI